MYTPFLDNNGTTLHTTSYFHVEFETKGGKSKYMYLVAIP